ncbi:recombination protein [Megaira polyxenophila phage MAnkyphage_25.80]|nr:recombination protein [Megaira polyxenophila phage MAnkyphage_25.80]
MSNIATVNTSTNMFDVMEKAYKFACIIAKSDIVPNHYRGKPENAFIAVQTAYRMNLDPMQVMQNTFVVSGKLGMVSSFAISLANQSGLFDSGIRYRIEGSGENLKVTAYANLKKTGEEISYTITMREAMAENWTKNPKYKTLPELMLRYRAATFLIRTHAPEVLNGMYMVEEIEDAVIATKDVTPKAQSVSSKLDSVLSYQEEEVTRPEPNETLEELIELVKLHDVSGEVINKWTRAAGVESIADLDAEKQLSCIEWINKQYNYSQNIEAA